MIRFLRLHQRRISNLEGQRKNDYAPQNNDFLTYHQKSKQRARTFNNIMRNIRIKEENIKFLNKLTEISEGKLVFILIIISHM